MKNQSFDNLIQILKISKNIETLNNSIQKNEFKYEEEVFCGCDACIELKHTHSYLESYIHHLNNLENKTEQTELLKENLIKSFNSVDESLKLEKSIIQDHSHKNDQVFKEINQDIKTLEELYQNCDFIEGSFSLNSLDEDTVLTIKSIFINQNIPFDTFYGYSLKFIIKKDIDIVNLITEKLNDKNLKGRFTFTYENFDIYLLEKILPDIFDSLN